MKILKLFFIIYFININNVYAYIDPGSSSYIYQFLIAGIFGVFYMFKQKMKNLLKVIKKFFIK